MSVKSAPRRQDTEQSAEGESPQTSSSDADIVTRVCNGDIAAFELLMRRYNQQLYRLARGILLEEQEAMDAVQNTYLTAYTQLSQLKDSDALGAWLSRILYNEAVGRLRQLSRYEFVEESEMRNTIDMTNPNNAPLSDAANQQLCLALEESIDRLSLEYRCVFILRGVQQLSTAETALSLDLSDDVVKTRYLRAKRKLRQLLSAKILSAGLNVHEFAGWRCDRIVEDVMRKVREM